ncbi:radical SAM/SPASM domain-containing protein [Anaerocolumna sp. MB42-C2]|uniref:radical SAM/SPASM domain-containing protein n=1 Tax=Anaerocolumna sp. MB42-C2 TaxID=3070997 RepID=UPI0027E1705D|nr:radical SAM protein [Anaerocolumna sp. MB42-C2]WMJ87608.1 radical SAM protein [Anaerocolumna sp. MB42-C2]
MVLAPFQVDFDVTMKCMYKCRHCNVAAGEKLNDEMSSEQIKKVLDQLDEVGVSDVSITGGEPLLREDCLELLEYAGKKEGFYLTLNTNGLLLNEEKIKFLEAYCPKINIAVSLDGYNPETYSVLRKSYIEYDKILDQEFFIIVENLKRLVKSKLSVGINYTITHATINNIWKTYEFINGLGIKRMLGIKFFPYGHGRLNREILELNYDEWKDFLVDATAKKSKDDYYHGVQISVTCPWEMYVPLLENGYTEDDVVDKWDYCSPLKSELYRRKRNLGCHAGITSCAISPNGDLYPCGTISSKFPPFVCGNLKEKDLMDIWQNSTVLKKLRNLDISMIEGNCKECKYVELCGGGCRARAFTQFNSLVAQDYLCPLNCIKEREGVRDGNAMHC